MLWTQKQVRPEAGVWLVGEGVGVGGEGRTSGLDREGKEGFWRKQKKISAMRAALDIFTKGSSPFSLSALT